jgi:hypothetical protein
MAEPEQGAFPEILPPEEQGPRDPRNGGGRQKGSQNLKYRVFDRVARSFAVPIIQRMCELGLEGDTNAAKLILDRVWPRPRSAPITIDLPVTKSPAELRAAMHGILADVASGRIAPDQGHAIVGMMQDILESHKVQVFDAAGAIEVENTNARDQLEKRLRRAIEERAKQAGAETTSPD